MPAKIATACLLLGLALCQTAYGFTPPTDGMPDGSGDRHGHTGGAGTR